MFATKVQLKKLGNTVNVQSNTKGNLNFAVNISSQIVGGSNHYLLVFMS